MSVNLTSCDYHYNSSDDYCLGRHGQHVICMPLGMSASCSSSFASSWLCGTDVFSHACGYHVITTCLLLFDYSISWICNQRWHGHYQSTHTRQHIEQWMDPVSYCILQAHQCYTAQYGDFWSSEWIWSSWNCLESFHWWTKLEAMSHDKKFHKKTELRCLDLMYWVPTDSQLHGVKNIFINNFDFLPNSQLAICAPAVCVWSYSCVVHWDLCLNKLAIIWL